MARSALAGTAGAEIIAANATVKSPVPCWHGAKRELKHQFRSNHCEPLSPLTACLKVRLV